MLEKLSIKRLYKIIGSVILAVLIFLCVLIFASKNKKKPEKTNPSGNVDSSMVDESSDKDSSNEDSSSIADSKTDSKTDSSSVKDESSAVVTDVQGKVIPTAPSSGGTQPPSGSTTTKTPTGTTTPPATTGITFKIEKFSPYAEKNITTGLGVPVFEYIFGKQTFENGIPTKCIQQNDTVVLSTGSKITSLDFDDTLITATKTSDTTIEVKATYRSGQYDIKSTILTVNGKYQYKFNIYMDTTYSSEWGYYDLLKIYWNGRCGTVITSLDPVVTYTNGDVNKSFTQRPIKLSNHQFDDTIDFRKGQSIAEFIHVLDFYKSQDFTKVRMRTDVNIKYLYFGASK